MRIADCRLPIADCPLPIAEMTWTHKIFSDLTPTELYAIMQLRIEVFVVEQACIYQDADDKDLHSWHLMGWKDGRLVAYTRIVPPGVAYEYVSIGRVVTSPLIRKLGMGRELMERSIALTNQIFGKGTIKIGAQLYLKRFYESLGFIQTSDVYLEDGIEHVEMVMG